MPNPLQPSPCLRCDPARYPRLRVCVHSHHTRSYAVVSSPLGCPPGPFTALIDNLTFVQPEEATGSGSLILIGQHCGLSGHNGNVEGQACSVQYFLKNMDWSHVPADMRRVQFGVSGGNPMVPIVTTTDLSLDGYQSLISPLLNGFSNVSGCETTSQRWSYATGCAHRARRLMIWPKPDAPYVADAAELPWTLPESMRSTGFHTYNGKEYAVYCAFNGCKPWNRAAFERYAKPPVGEFGKWTETDNDEGAPKQIGRAHV